METSNHAQIHRGTNGTTGCIGGKKRYFLINIKKNINEKKICTLRVDTNYRHRGIGYQLLLKSFEVLGTDWPLMTINEEHQEEYKKLFQKVNAKYCNKVRSLYNWGVDEYFYNIPYVHKNALFSIKPQYVEEMKIGKKRVEFRKKIYREPIERIYVYSSSPIKRIVGYIDNPKIQEGFPSSLWNMFRDTAGIDKESFDEYYCGCEVGYAVCFDKFVQFSNE